MQLRFGLATIVTLLPLVLATNNPQVRQARAFGVKPAHYARAATESPKGGQDSQCGSANSGSKGLNSNGNNFEVYQSWSGGDWSDSDWSGSDWSGDGSQNGFSTSIVGGPSSATSQIERPSKTPSSSSSSLSAKPTTSSSSSGTGSGSSSSSGSGDGSWKDQVLNYHNQVRAKHQASALTWDDSLAQYASHYLSTNNCEFKHSGGPHGENIAIGYQGLGALKAWYEEYKQYSYDNPGFSEGTGHFTQMVWKSTTKLGCAKKACSNGEYVVCEYDPAGNIVTGDAFKNNVLPEK